MDTRSLHYSERENSKSETAAFPICTRKTECRSPGILTQSYQESLKNSPTKNDDFGPEWATPSISISSHAASRVSTTQSALISPKPHDSCTPLCEIPSSSFSHPMNFKFSDSSKSRQVNEYSFDGVRKSLNLMPPTKYTSIKSNAIFYHEIKPAFTQNPQTEYCSAPNLTEGDCNRRCVLTHAPVKPISEKDSPKWKYDPYTNPVCPIPTVSRKNKLSGSQRDDCTTGTFNYAQATAPHVGSCTSQQERLEWPNTCSEHCPYHRNKLPSRSAPQSHQPTVRLAPARTFNIPESNNECYWIDHSCACVSKQPLRSCEHCDNALKSTLDVSDASLDIPDIHSDNLGYFFAHSDGSVECCHSMSNRNDTLPRKRKKSFSSTDKITVGYLSNSPHICNSDRSSHSPNINFKKPLRCCHCMSNRNGILSSKRKKRLMFPNKSRARRLSDSPHYDDSDRNSYSPDMRSDKSAKFCHCPDNGNCTLLHKRKMNLADVDNFEYTYKCCSPQTKVSFEGEMPSVYDINELSSVASYKRRSDTISPVEELLCDISDQPPASSCKRRRLTFSPVQDMVGDDVGNSCIPSVKRVTTTVPSKQSASKPWLVGDPVSENCALHPHCKCKLSTAGDSYEYITENFKQHHQLYNPQYCHGCYQCCVSKPFISKYQNLPSSMDAKSHDFRPTFQPIHIPVSSASIPCCGNQEPYQKVVESTCKGFENCCSKHCPYAQSFKRQYSINSSHCDCCQFSSSNTGFAE